MPTAAAAPAMTSSSERTARLSRSPSTVASMVARMGVMSGATIIAPITVAVEIPATTPAEAMTAASTSSIQKREYFCRRQRPVEKTASASPDRVLRSVTYC